MTNNRNKITNVKSETEIEYFDLNFSELILLLNSSKFAPLEFFASVGLLKNEKNCDLCGNEMILYKKMSKKDFYRWECKKICNKTNSVRFNTIFEGSHLRLDQIAMLIYLWCQETPQIKIKHELEINKNTIGSWCNKFREVCEYAVENEGNLLGGLDDDGNPIDVEIDESLFFKRKFNRSRFVILFGCLGLLNGIQVAVFLSKLKEGTLERCWR